MRGDTPITIPVPTIGWLTALPPHLLPPNCLRNGQNMLVGLDGVLSPRGGYARLEPQPDGLPGDPRIVAGIDFTDSDGEEVTVIASLTNWYVLGGSPLDWQLIAGLGFSSDKDTAVRLVPFGFDAGGHVTLYGCNGFNFDPIAQWVAPSSANPVVAVVGAPRANDIDVIADRLVAVNIFDAQHFPQLVAWTPVLDGTTWPVLARNPISGIGNLVAVRATSRTAGVVYGQSGAFSIQGVQGDDAGAFVFDKIESVTCGPISPNALISVGGIHYYLGFDFHIWRCDGQGAQIISGPIDAGIKPGAQPTSLAMLPSQRAVAAYDSVNQRVWFFVAFNGDDDPQHGLPLNLPIEGVREGAWQVSAEFPEPITAAFPVTEQLAPTWDNPGSHGQTTVVGAVGAGDTTIPVVSTAGFPLEIDPDTGMPGGCVSINFDPTLLTGELIVYHGLTPTALLGCERGAFGTTPAAYAGGETVISEITWDDAGLLWANWNAIPDQNQPALYLGTGNGFVCRFEPESTMDPEQQAIEYAAQWGLISHPNATQELQINTGDVYLDPVAGDNPELRTAVLTTPHDDAPIVIDDRVLVGNDKATWLYRLDATVAVAAFQPGNYLDVQLSGQSNHGGPKYNGATLYADVRKRPDRLPVPGLEGPTAQ